MLKPTYHLERMVVLSIRRCEVTCGKQWTNPHAIGTTIGYVNFMSNATGEDRPPFPLRRVGTALISICELSTYERHD